MRHNYQNARRISIRNLLRVLLLTFIVEGTFNLEMQAQPHFTRTTFNAPYVPITLAGGATESTATGNDVNQTAIPLGFTFNYDGVDYTALGLNTNGALWFDAVAPSAAEGAYNTNMYWQGGGGSDKSISAWWNDMTDDASSSILYQTQGTVGSQTFTVEYFNYPHYTGAVGTNIRLNFQVIFYEGTNIIEFRYGTISGAGPAATAGGACIGIEYGSGGEGNYMDLVTGSGSLAHGMLSPLLAWPSYNYRITPGAPTPVSAGTYNVGVGQTYESLTLATSDLNHRGISGPVTLNLTDDNYDVTPANGDNIFPIFVGPVASTSAINTLTISKTGTPTTISYQGSPVVQGGFGSGYGLGSISDSEEPIMGVCSRYTTISNINLVSLGTTANDVEVGLMVFEAEGGTTGAHHNLFDQISVNMDRTNSNTVAIWSKNISGPGGFEGTNSYNTYRDITIRDSYTGLHLDGVGTATGPPDIGNQIITSSCDLFNSIGDPNVPNDIGGGTSFTSGIRLGAQENFVLRNTIVCNVTTTNTNAQIDGINVESIFGTCELSNNIVRNITRNSSSSNNPAVGIRLTSSGNQLKEMRVFNNSVSDVRSAYTGVPTAARKAIGMLVIGSGNIGKQKMFIWNNSVSMDGSAFPNASNTCFEISSGDVEHIVKNNVFANFTSAQSGVAKHYCFVSPLANSIGYSVFSSSDYNDLYIANDQSISGHVALGAATNYNTVVDWQAGITVQPGTDANSFSANPGFANILTDLHASNLSVALNGTGTTLPVYITNDIDCQTRTAPHDIGFDDFNFYTYFADADLDTYGDAGNTTETTSTTPPVGFVISNTDCDDTNAAINPGAAEDFCNNIDDDCDGFTDEGAVDGCTNPLACNYNASATCDDGSCSAGILWYLDGDSDTYYSTTQNACTSPGAGWSDTAPVGGAGDCDDSNAGINPGASEIACNGIDEDCDSFIDEGSSSGCMNPLACNYNAAATCDNGSCTFETMWYLDADNDTYYTSSQMACTSPGMGWVSTLPAGGSGDCNDNNASRNPGASEVCGNAADDDCDGLVDEGCVGGGGNNDSPGGATVVSFSGNAYPSCGAYNGNLTNATVSSEGNPSNVITGEDIWFSFYAASPAVRVVLNTTNFDGVLELHDAGNNELDAENMTGFGSSEIMNFVGLIENMQYFVAVRNYNSALGTGAFSICIQYLMDSNCDAGSGSYALCSNFKADYSGANQYIFHFTPSGGGATTSASGTSQVSLGLVSLGLQYGATYTNTIDAVYYLADGAGNPETIVVPGNEGCTVTIAAQPDVQVKATQRCPATILRGTTLQGKPFVCGAIQFRFEFTETDQFGSPIGVPFSRLTSGASPTMVLNFNSPQALVPGSFYSVRIKPIMSYGEGSYGTANCIKIGGTSQLEWTQDEELSEVESQMELSVYPNPNNGGMIHINLTDASAEIAILDILDAQGRSIYSKQESITDSFNTTIQFDYALPSGLYMVKVRMGNDVLVERMHVVK